MNYGEGYSLSDIAAATGNGANNGMFGDNGAWWVIIFLIFAFAGWGGNRGFGGFGGGSSGAADNYVLASDFATLQRQMSDGFNSVNRKSDAIQEGICDSTFALNNTINNGFFGVQNALCQGFSGINQNIVTNGYETRLATQGLSSQLANCCCDIERQIADCCCTTQRSIDAVNYNMAMNTNTLQNAMCLNTRDLIENQNANYRALHDEIVANRIEDKNAQIQAQQNEINSLRLAASQERQNNYLINELKPCPIPAYITCNPYQSYGYTYANGCGCNSGCSNNF